jgi:hypothetical protein
MDQLDLDINNYTLKDIERFFQLQPNSKYSASDVESKEYKIREQLLASGHINKRFKRDLIEFLTLAKEWLIFVKCKDSVKAPTTIPKNYKLDTLDTPFSREPNPRTDEIITRPKTQYIQAMNGEFFPGELNPLNTRVITKCLNIDTRFREDLYSTQSSDLTIKLPEKYSKVVSMQLATIELPVCFYGISKENGNNFLYMAVKFTDPSGSFTDNTSTIIDTDQDGNSIFYTEQVFELPVGNYNAPDFIDSINNTLSPKDATGNPTNTANIYSYIEFKIDITTSGSGTGKITVYPTGIFSNNITEIIMDFARDIDGQPSSIDISTRIGWNMGYIYPQYNGNTSYTAETIVEPAKIRYIYLVVDDFNNSANNYFVSVFSKHTLSPNILARISIRGSYFSLIMDNDHKIISEPRLYFGPVDIQKLRVRLIDEHGRVLNMNNSNFSFSIILKMLYDL